MNFKIFTNNYDELKKDYIKLQEECTTLKVEINTLEELNNSLCKLIDRDKNNMHKMNSMYQCCFDNCLIFDKDLDIKDTTAINCTLNLHKYVEDWEPYINNHKKYNDTYNYITAIVTSNIQHDQVTNYINFDTHTDTKCLDGSISIENNITGFNKHDIIQIIFNNEYDALLVHLSTKDFKKYIYKLKLTEINQL